MNQEIIKDANNTKNIFLYWGVSSFCNLRCTYCYVPEYNKSMAKGLNTLAINQTKSLIEKVKNSEYNLATVTLHGAEAFILTPETIKTIVPLLHANTSSKLIGSQTNGVLLTNKYHDRMGDLSAILKIGFTLDPKTLHNKDRENTYDLVINNINIALERGYKCSVLTTIGGGITDNIEELQDIINFCEEKKVFLVMKYIHTEDGSYMLRDDEKDKWIDWLYTTKNYKYIQNFSPSFCINGGCYGGFFEFGVNGDVTACNKTNTKDGVFANWIDDTLDEVWLKRQTLFTNIKKPLECYNCEYHTLCYSGCPVDRDSNGFAIDCYIKRKLYNMMHINNENIGMSWVKSSIPYRREQLLMSKEY